MSETGRWEGCNYEGETKVGTTWEWARQGGGTERGTAEGMREREGGGLATGVEPVRSEEPCTRERERVGLQLCCSME